jgi:subtilisin family serine protease
LIAGRGKGSERKQVSLLSGKKKVVDTQRPYAGVAPNARIISLKVLDEHGAGYTSAVLDAIEFAVANR